MTNRNSKQAKQQEVTGSLLPTADVAREWLYKMILIRHFEERSGEMYARAKVGGFLHLGIGEEATIVGTVAALQPNDYLVATYRDHGHPLTRGTDPKVIMAELFGREDGCCRGRGGSMHLFDLERRFMGGYGIVGGNLPLAAGMALSCKYRDSDEVVVCQFGDGAINQGTFGETMNLAALWKLPIVFIIVNNQFGMGTSLERHSGSTDLQRRGEGYGVPGTSCDGMDIVNTQAVVNEAIRRARTECQPTLIEAITYRFRGHSYADPEEYRTKEEVLHWQQRDPIKLFSTRLLESQVVTQQEVEEFHKKALSVVDEAVDFADQSPHPAPESLYDNIYVFGEQVRGWYSLDERSADSYPGEHERSRAEEQNR